MTPDQADKKSELLDHQLNLLKVSFDSVLLLCTKHDEDSTYYWVRTSGNRYASVGIAQEWINRETEHAQSDD